MKKILVLFTILIVSSALYADNKKQKLFVTFMQARVHTQPNALSKQIRTFEYGTGLGVERAVGEWWEVNLKRGKGYIFKEALIDAKNFKRQTKVIKVKGGKKGFSEDDDVAAATKGFSEEDDIAAATKGFSEEDEVAAATKGFNKNVEKKYRARNKGLRYDLVDKIDFRGKKKIKKNKKEVTVKLLNPRSLDYKKGGPVRFYLKFRRKGKLGEFAPKF